MKPDFYKFHPVTSLTMTRPDRQKTLAKRRDRKRMMKISSARRGHETK
jgi:hypothetical protein